MRLLSLVAVLFTLILSLGCGEGPTQPASDLFEAALDPNPAPPADQELGLEGTDRFMIKMANAALGEKFLLSMSTIPQKAAATSTGLAAKVVTFRQFGNVVDMYEVNDGNVVTDNLPAQTLLAQFPVSTSAASTLTFDFDAGMRDVYTSIWYAPSGEFTAQEATLDIRASRVFEVKKEGELLMIRHAILARQSSIFGDVNTPVEMRYYLTKYEDSDFKAKEVGHLKNVGFFGVPVKLEKYSGRTVNNAIRFDLRKNLTFYYSANTPADYVEAVKDGITYWNKAFGKDIVKAEVAPQGVTAPDPKHNVVQWVEWDEAGFAYADVLANPLNGESLHGQVYMTSVFAFKSKERVRKLIRLLATAAEKKGDDKQGMIVPNFAKPLIACSRYTGQEFSQQLMSSLESILGDEKITEEAILRVSQDYVREVIAHEIGHVLGLRHNFAGTDDSNMTPKEKREWLDNYLRNKAELKEDKVPVTTVMDYSTPIDAYYVGWFIRNAKTALPYDKSAIQWGYFDDNTVEENKGLFCTDDHVLMFSDCNRFDQGPSVADVSVDQLAEAISTLPGNLIENVIAKKTAYHPSLQQKVREQILDPVAYAKTVVAPVESFLLRLDADKRLVSVDRDFDFVGPLNEEAIYAARWERLNKELEAVGGVEAVLFQFLPGDLAVKAKQAPQNSVAAPQVSVVAWQATFEKALESEAYKEFVGGDGKKHSFSDAEKTYLKAQAKVFFKKVETEVVKQFINVFQKKNLNLGTVTNDGQVQDEDVANVIQTHLTAIIGKIVLAQSKNAEPITGTLNGAGVWVKPFIYDQETRELAAGTFATLQGNFLGWADAPKKALGEKLKTSVHGALNISKIADFNAGMLSPSILHWYKNQQKIGAKVGASL